VSASVNRKILSKISKTLNLKTRALTNKSLVKELGVQQTLKYLLMESASQPNPISLSYRRLLLRNPKSRNQYLHMFPGLRVTAKDLNPLLEPVTPRNMKRPSSLESMSSFQEAIQKVASCLWVPLNPSNSTIKLSERPVTPGTCPSLVEKLRNKASSSRRTSPLPTGLLQRVQSGIRNQSHLIGAVTPSAMSPKAFAQAFA